MKRPSRGSHPLAHPILIATALVVAGALSTGLTHYQLGLAEQAEHAARSGLRQSEAELQQAEATLQRNRNTASAWDRLRAGEARNSPPRNAWIEALERLRADPGQHVEELDFGFEPEHPITAPGSPEGLTGIRETRLHLSARVAHEEHFLKLLSLIRQLGLSSVQHCSLARATDERQEDAMPTNGILMRCDFSILHIDIPP